MSAEAHAALPEPAFEIAHSFSGRRWRLPATDADAVRADGDEGRDFAIAGAVACCVRGVAAANEARDYLQSDIETACCPIH